MTFSTGKMPAEMKDFLGLHGVSCVYPISDIVVPGGNTQRTFMTQRELDLKGFMYCNQLMHVFGVLGFLASLVGVIAFCVWYGQLNLEVSVAGLVGVGAVAITGVLCFVNLCIVCRQRRYGEQMTSRELLLANGDLENVLKVTKRLLAYIIPATVEGLQQIKVAK